MLIAYTPKELDMRYVTAFLLLLSFIPITSVYSADSNCCRGMLGIQYCDSSAGRYVCANGYYSSCYCTRHAVMDLQKIEGCCLWQGGVFKIDKHSGLVICRDGGISSVCSAQKPSDKTVSLW